MHTPFYPPPRGPWRPDCPRHPYVIRAVSDGRWSPGVPWGGPRGVPRGSWGGIPGCLGESGGIPEGSWGSWGASRARLRPLGGLGGHGEEPLTRSSCRKLVISTTFAPRSPHSGPPPRTKMNRFWGRVKNEPPQAQRGVTKMKLFGGRVENMKLFKG